jgi:hypothetical protein
MQIHDGIVANLALAIFTRLPDLMAILAIAVVGHFELRAAIFADDCFELNFLRAHRAFLECLVHDVSPRRFGFDLAEAEFNNQTDLSAIPPTHGMHSTVWDFDVLFES